MRKMKYKSVKKLYGDQSEVLKVTPMLKGSLCSEGLADEGDFAAPLNMGSFNAEKGFVSAQFSSSKLGLKEESGKCNVCATSCSPCLHSEQMATKTNGSSGEACQKKDSNLCSSNDTTDLSPPQVNSPCNDRHHRSSETNHPLTSCLSRESSENVESEETWRDCNTSDGIEIIIRPNLHQNCADNCGSLKAPIFHDKNVLNQLEKPESECLGDNISFICGSDCAETRASDGNSDANKKNASYSSASVDSFSETEKAVSGHAASCCLVGSPCGRIDDNNPRRSNRSSNESSQEIFCCSNKSDLSEISSLRDSCAGASLAKGEHSECSEEQVQSSVARPDALQISSQIGGEHNSVDSMQVDTGINEGEQTAEVKSTTVVKKVNMEETTIGSQPAACSDGSDSMEYEVKVCDICGNLGREELLAVCSKCNDGAEHIYCMRVKMDNVPKGDWMCEECMLSKETENQKQKQSEGGVESLKKSHTLELETKGLEVKERKANKVGSIPLFSSKRPAGSLQPVRKRPFGAVLKSPSTSSSSSKTLMHQSGGRSSSPTMKTLCIPTKSSSRPPKLPSQSQVSRGFLSKSKSFSAVNLKEDVQLLKKDSCRNEGFIKETAASESKGRVRMISKSLSLKNMKSYSVNNCNHDNKSFPNSSNGEDLKISRHPKGQYSTKTGKTLRLANSDSFASIADERIASPGKFSLPHSSSSSHQDLRAMKGHEISNNSFERSFHSAQGDSANEEKKMVVNVRQHVDYPTEVVPATSTKYSNANVHSDEWRCWSWISAIPQHDFMWQGKFEIQRSGGLPFTCDGMQAHLSTHATDKVLEVVRNLPRKLLLEEAPRLTMWPTQFTKSHATEDNIALYFFAKDLDSYEGSYKNLLYRMIKNDFGLKGNFGGVELLIFTSNLLPEKSRRWNNMLFLWGVFRGSRQIPAVSASENLFPLGMSSISASLVSCNTQQTSQSNTLLDSKAVTSGRMVGVCESKSSSWELKPPDLQTSCSKHVARVDDQIKRECFSRADTSQREERESKGRPEIDLNYSLQESQEYSEDCSKANGSHECKRLKSCINGTNIGNNSIKDTNESCSIAINGKGSGFSGEFKCNGTYDMPIVSPQLDSVGNNYSWKSLQQQVISNESGDRQDPSVSCFELKLGVERSSSDQGNAPPFFMLMGSKDLKDVNSSREASADTDLSLALSLALPYPMTSSEVLKLDSEMKLPKWPDLNTTLSLF